MSEYLDPADPASGQDRRERDFERGFAYGAEWTITAHDPLLQLAALYSARLPALEAVEVDEFVLETMRAVRRVREGQASALDFYRRERDGGDS